MNDNEVNAKSAVDLLSVHTDENGTNVESVEAWVYANTDDADYIVEIVVGRKCVRTGADERT